MPKNDPEYQRTYQREYRARRKAEDDVDREILAQQLQGVDPTTLPELDRHGSSTLEKEPPSWEELIPKMPDRLIDKILNHPAMFDPRKHAKRDAP